MNYVSPRLHFDSLAAAERSVMIVAFNGGTVQNDPDLTERW